MSSPSPALAGVADQGRAWPEGSRAFLLDVNVLIALLDPLHSHHGRAQEWFATAGQAWSSCVLTQNAVLRIMAHPGYSNPMPSIAGAARLLADLCAQPAHRFWSGDLSLLDSDLVDRGKLLAPKQIADTWLLALAVHHGGQLASFDRRLVTSAVRGGTAALHLI